MANNRINITDTIDNSQIGRFQVGVFVLCGLCLIMDGFDVQSWGFVAPALFAEWGTKSSAGTVASFTLTGVLIGSLLFSMLADKIGRRPVLIGATLYFSVLTLITTQVTSLNQLLLIRFIAVSRNVDSVISSGGLATPLNRIMLSVSAAPSFSL